MNTSIGSGDIGSSDVQGRVLIAGQADGVLKRLSAPISFWGGVDAVAGRIADSRHPDVGLDLRGRILAVPATVGSSSSSAVMLEMIREGTAPAALLLGEVDPILVLGVVVARELGYGTIPVIHLGRPAIDDLPVDGRVPVSLDGVVRSIAS